LFVVDTNVLVYAADADSPAHAPCRERLLDWGRRSDPWHVTWGIAYEFLRVATHPRVFRSPMNATMAWEFLSRLFRAPGFSVLVAGDGHSRVLESLVAELPDVAGNRFHDAHTAALMREHGIRVIWTRDVDFHRFPFLEVRDPLRG
jgi:toxin-antitoxin system PIN domain toxin